MLNIHIIIPFVVALIMIAVVAIASGYPYLQAKLSILFSGGLVLVLALVQLVREMRLAKKPAVKPPLSKHSATPALYGIESAWMLGFALTIYLLGFIIAIPLYICSYMKLHGARWPAALITGISMSAFCYIVFVLVLDMKLYPGEIFIRLGLGQG